MMMRSIFLLCILVVPAFAQMDVKPPDWQPFKYFVGSWEGTTKGDVGSGKSEREYKLAMNGMYLEVKTKSLITPPDKNAKSEVHEDFGFVSYDQMKKKYILRQFHSEGFVNQYLLSGLSADNKGATWESESIQNIESGWRAREKFKIVSNDEFVETFELAPPGQDFAPFTETTFKRKR